MRYFLFTYTGVTDVQSSVGNLWGEFDSFPSNAFLKSEAAEDSGLNDADIVITGWNEFKSKEDYDSFSP